VRLVKPWPEPYAVNRRSWFGPRVHPITGKRTFHHGVDVAMPVGTPLTAPADGVVVHKANTASAGNNLIIRHEGTWHTVYYHLHKPSPFRVGDKVTTGEVIAFSGNTGASTGPHLHWELRRTRTWGDSVDPLPYLVTELHEDAPKPTVQAPVMPEPPTMPTAPTRPTRFPPIPMSPKLASFFQIRRGLK
jgi:murein DD-endopeptidase MepM/ murein hydrolase activator NlpD